MSKYGITEAQRQRIETDFTYHPPTADQATRYDHLRARIKLLAYEIVAETPPSREQSRALTALEDVMYNTNAAIARNEKDIG